MRHTGWMVVLLASGALAADLLVDATAPGAYRTLQAALDAASPGDRILVGTTDLGTLGMRTTIRKSVTIQSAQAGRAVLVWMLTNGAPMPRLVLEGLTPGIPLVFRHLEFQVHPDNSLSPGPLLATSSALPGEVRFEDVQVLWAGGGRPLEYAITLADLQVTHLVLRQCRFSAGDTASNAGCRDIPDTRGASALRFTGDTLVLEDTTLRAGSANFLRKVDCGGVGEYPIGGPGGSALVAASKFTSLVRTQLSDGNGGSVQTGSWTLTPVPGPAGQSQLTGPSGTLAAFRVEAEAGLPGALVPGDPGPLRGERVNVGAVEAPLVFLGSGRLGSTATLLLGPTLNPPLGILLGFQIGPMPTPFGWFLCDGTQPMLGLMLTAPGTFAFLVPNDPTLIDLLVVAQLVEGSPIRAGAPAILGIQR